MTLNLTLDQKQANDKFIQFLLSDKKEFYLFGAAGCGKTFLTQFFIKNTFPQYLNMCRCIGIEPAVIDFALTATTNKAVEVLQQNFVEDYVETVFKYFKVVVVENYKNGEVYLKQDKYYSATPKMLIIVDECSMLSREMLKIIRKHSSNCKIVFVGDNYQLTPVNEKAYWNNTPEDVTAVLTTPVRNNGNTHLIDLCSQLRETVDTKEFKDILLFSGSIDHLDDDSVVEYLKNDYNVEKARILCYTNVQVLNYINYLKNAYGIPKEIELHKPYINNHNISDGNKTHFYAEELLKVTAMGEPYYKTFGNCSIEGRDVIVSSIRTYKQMHSFIPESYTKVKEAIKKYKKLQDWKTYFQLSLYIMDLRLPYASTVHKAQGSTFDEVLIDLDSFGSCKDPDVAARLLYVAVSRAKKRVLFYGSLPKRYGEIKCQVSNTA